MFKLLLIDNDEKSVNFLLRLLPVGISLSIASSIQESYRCINLYQPHVIMLEITLEESIAFLEKHCSDYLNAPVLVYTGTDETSRIVTAMKTGALDYLPKTSSADSVIEKITEIRENTLFKTRNSDLSPENKALKSIIGESEQICGLKALIQKYARSDYPVLITGESGTGKELAARALHSLSSRKTGPYVPLNCGAIPGTLIESELFGCVKGAYTDAVNKRGCFENSSGGTIFLDEIAEMPCEAQVKLLRVLEEQEVQPLGSARTIKTDSRVISATNVNLPDCIRKNLFRSDLYYRLNVLNLHIPPLRERREDIPLLISHFLAVNGINKKISRAAVEKLVQYSWPGNARELKNVILRAGLLCPGNTIYADQIVFI